MQFKNMISGAAVLLASASTVSALGVATVINNCGSPVYFASVGGSSNPAMAELQGSYSQGYANPGVGTSIKLSPSDSTSGVSQFEFTLSAGMISYDLSNIDGYPFAAGGMEVVPSTQNDPSFPTCVPISCPAGQSSCSAAYNAPDDIRTMVCSSETSLTLTMCPGGPAKRSVSFIEVVSSRMHARSFPKLA